MVRNVVNNIFSRKEIKCQLIILNIIAVKKHGSKQRIRKLVLQNKEISATVKRNILKNFKEIMHDLESNHPHLLVVKYS